MEDETLRLSLPRFPIIIPASVKSFFRTFDAPSRELCSKRRMPSNTPVQALAVMNDPAF